jgi:hypothetical protein
MKTRMDLEALFGAPVECVKKPARWVSGLCVVCLYPKDDSFHGGGSCLNANGTCGGHWDKVKGGTVHEHHEFVSGE